MTATVEPQGLGILALSRMGDLSTTVLIPHTKALSLTYSITISKYNKPLSLTYTIQRRQTTSLLLYYLVAPVGDFAINGDGTIIRPDRITYTPRTVSGRTMLGGPVLQGYSTMTWQYSVLSWPEWKKLIGFYNPQNPVVQLTYPDDLGVWQQKQAVMLPPTYGAMTTFLLSGVALTFTRLG